MLTKVKIMKRASAAFTTLALCASVALGSVAIPGPGVFAADAVPASVTAADQVPAAVAAIPAASAADAVPAYLNTSLSYLERAADLVSRMSLAEKQAQLIPYAPAIPRLGLRAYQYQNEALHGIAKNEGGVSFPSPIGTASSWNPDLMLKVGTVVSDEIRAYYNDAIGRGLCYYSPTMNELRDPRWGRNEEAYSEDPFITAVFGEQFVRGMEGIGDGVKNTNPGAEYGADYIKVIPTLKHYAANNSEKNRNSGTYDVDNKTLRDYYTWAFQRIVQNTDAASVMSAYNAINGIPCSANGYLLTTLLRDTFGFHGFVVNDCGAINDQILNHKWVPPGADHSVTPPEAVAYSIKAGNNMDCGGGVMNWVYNQYAIPAVDAGLLTEDEIDHDLIQILLTRFETGEFDGSGGAMAPYSQADGYVWAATAETQAHRDATLDAALQAAVLLKNENQTLPVDISKTGVRVFGPLMNVVDLGDYSGSPKTDMINFKTGMTNLAASKGFSSNVAFYDGMTPATVSTSDANDMLRVGWIGLYPGDGVKNAAAADAYYNLNKSSNYLYNVQDGSYIKFANVDINKMGNYEVRVGSGSNKTFKVNANFHLDSPNGEILATVICPPTGDVSSYGSVVPTAFAPITTANRLTAGFSSYGDENGPFSQNGFLQSVYNRYQSVNNGIHDIYVTFSYDRTPALNASQIDNAAFNGVSVVFIGTTTSFSANTNAAWNPYRVCSEGSDRPNIKFPAGQEYLVNAVAQKAHAAGGKVAVVIQSVGTMDISPFVDNVDAIMWTAYNGQRQGEADAKLVLGDYSPGGHLTQTWYADDSQLYSYPDGFLWDYSIDNRNGNMGRTYMYFNGIPRYPFGYGLSYTRFSVGNVKISDADADGNINVTADVTNTGSVRGAEVVQVYVQAPGHGNGVVPNKQLKGFARVELNPGQTQTAHVALDVKDLASIDPGTIGPDGFAPGKRVLTPGDYNIIVATDSATPVSSRTVSLTQIPLRMKTVTLRDDKAVAVVGNRFGSSVTVCMTDETFLDPHASGLNIRYSSSNPAAASVNAATGEVTALSGGTSLITAVFDYNGQEMTASYPVAVLDMACLDSLSVNGAPLQGFRYNNFQYSIKLSPCDTTEIPAITYTASNAFAVTMTPAAKIPGTTTIEVTRGTEDVIYEIDFSYEDMPLQNVDEELANFNWFASQGPLSTGTAQFNNGIYFDWRNIGPVNSGSAFIDLKDYSNRNGLYLTFTMDFSAQDQSVPFSQIITDASVGNGSVVKLRSSDVAGKPGDPAGAGNTEHNFGWWITSRWNLNWGKNYIRIPLASCIGRSITDNNNRQVPTSEYMINVNGVDVPAAETTRGIIDWSDVRRMILQIWTQNNIYQNNKITLALENIKLVDAGVTYSNVTEDVATFNNFAATRSPKYATGAGNNSNEMYLDWTNVDSGSVDLKNNPHKANLYFTFDMVWHSTNETHPLSSLTFTNGANAVRLRSPNAFSPSAPQDASPPNTDENNFGWLIDSSWGAKLHWGDNIVRIPLGALIDSPPPTTNNNTPANGYAANINGVDIPTTEKHLHIIDWSKITQIIMMMWPGGIAPDETVSMELKNVKIIDTTVQQQTVALRAALERLMTPRLAQGDYSNASYAAYLAAYVKAGKIDAIADWPTPLMCAATQLQAAIAALEIGDVFSADFANSSAYVKNNVTAGTINGFAIAAVYSKNGVLTAVAGKPFAVSGGQSAALDFAPALDFSRYPAAQYDCKVFFWTMGYEPLTAPIVR